MSLTSDEVNCLIYNYLHESGFHHTSFALQSECDLSGGPYHNKKVQPGALVEFLQKGLLYKSMELHLTEDGVEVPCSNPVSLIGRHECVRPTPPAKIAPSDGAANGLGGQKKGGRKERGGPNRPAALTSTGKRPANGATDGEDTVMEDAVLLGSRPVKDLFVSPDPADAVTLSSKDVTLLHGHTGAVCAGQWSKRDPNVYASGSADAQVRIWTLGSGSKVLEPIHINCQPPNAKEVGQITFLDWHPSGALFAIGTSTGEVQVWGRDGERRFHSAAHEGPIIAASWNPRGTRLLTGGADGQLILWARTDQGQTAGRIEGRSSHHKDSVLDVAWRGDGGMFASSSQDLSVCLWRSEPSGMSVAPWRIYPGNHGGDGPASALGHSDEVNCVAWDPSGRYLASCADDSTVRIWDPERDAPVHVLTAEGGVNSIRWRPSAPTSDVPFLLASLSGDAIIRIWDAEAGRCLREIATGFPQPYAFGISPDGHYVTSGSSDYSLVVWRVEDGQPMCRYRCEAGLFEAGWNEDGARLAACLSDHSVLILEKSQWEGR